MKRGLGFFLGILLLGLASCSEQTEDLPDFNKMWNFQDPAATEAKFRELLPQAESSGNVSYHLQLVTQIARTLGLQGKFGEAHATLDTVEKQLTDDLNVARLRYLLERGRVFNSAGSPEESKRLFLEAWKLGCDSGEDYYAVDAAHMLGIVEPPEKQLDWSSKAMAVAEASKDERARKWLGPLYHNTGMTYLDLGEYGKALTILQKDWDYRKEAGSPLDIRIAKWSVAHTLRKLNRPEDALEMQKEIEKEIVAEEGDPDGYVFEEIGECLFALGRENLAQPYFEKAYALLSEEQWIKDSDPERLERLKRLADGKG
ncbi:tetratricopeptide repeat protein [Candidatus Eisenbacteria bacterium]|uniref:Tetratricopeptide repeat protein n=1 Tax=Eiseniibacteriota bacterium TaxID=2212470 RepID=A0ABV6YIN1_UNCEI